MYFLRLLEKIESSKGRRVVIEEHNTEYELREEDLCGTRFPL
jgi:hypothetical protein